MVARLLLVGALLTSPLAAAAGEFISVSPDTSPLKDALCSAMTCGDWARSEAAVRTRVANGQLEVWVSVGTGGVRVVDAVPVGSDGQPSAPDLARLVSRTLAAIEGREAPTATRVVARLREAPVRVVRR